MNHILNIEKQSEELFDIFRNIQNSNTILFLGAGASTGEKRYLSKEIIEYYEDNINKNYNEPDITKFVDYLSSDRKFHRSDFDLFVVNLLDKYEVTKAHKIMAGIPWREIITTNFDLLVEQAFDKINHSYQHKYSLKVIRNIPQLQYKEAHSEIKYIKLNGCIQDSSKYPLVFSSEDFKKSKSYYNYVLKELKNLSPMVSFLSIGYSFSDPFGKSLLERFDTFNFRDKKWMINVDPFTNENVLSYYTDKRICIVKCSFQEFFQKYEEWEKSGDQFLVQKKGLSVHNNKNYALNLPPKLLLNLDGIIKPLNLNTKDKYIKEEDFYKGEEPNFSIIIREIDVIKSRFIQTFISKIIENTENNSSNFIPLFFITGDFGIGKSTFTLRLIYELEKSTELDLVAIEIVDLDRLRKEDILSFVNYCKTKYIVLYCDEVEIESYFKSLLKLRRDLSMEQLQSCNILFIVPIRENILEKYKLTSNIRNSIELKLEGKLSEEEIDDFLIKLKNCNLINYRDAYEKHRLNEKIQRDYDSDSFISLMSIITSGKHENDLLSCYYQLSDECKLAFKYTALIHQHKLLMPSSWLKNIISVSWEEFLEKIVKSEGKGILLQENVLSYGTQPDLYFKTKHPLIAKKLIEILVPSLDKQYNMYKDMLKYVEIGQSNSYLISNLLKALKRTGDFNDNQINKLFDKAHENLKDDPFFLLNYAINLQERKNKPDIIKAINYLKYADSLLDKRNHRFIHRRAVLNFDLARLYYDTEISPNFTNIYLNEARELFIIKQIIDPFSSYSYVDYISMTIWELEKMKMDKESEMQKQILIEDLFELAERTVTEGIDKVHTLYDRYYKYLRYTSQDKDFKEYLDELYYQSALRPYACILLYKYYADKKDTLNVELIIEEMEHYQDNYEVIKFLHKYYSTKVYDDNVREKLIHLSNENPALETKDPLRYNYYRGLAEYYNHRYQSGRTYLNNIKKSYNHLNPEFDHIWKNSSGSDRLFEATIIQNSNESTKAVKIFDLQLTVKLIKGNYELYLIGTSVTVKLHFYLYGLLAEIVN